MPRLVATAPFRLIFFAVIFSAVTSILQGAVDDSVFVAEQVLRSARGITNLANDARVPVEERAVFFRTLIDVDDTAAGPLADAFDTIWLKIHEENAGVSRIALYRTSCAEANAISRGYREKNMDGDVNVDISLRVFAGPSVNDALKVRDTVTGELVDLLEGLEECLVEEKQGDLIRLNRRFESCNQPLTALERETERVQTIQIGEQRFAILQKLQRPTFPKPKMVDMIKVLSDVDFNARGRCVDPIYETERYWMRATQNITLAEEEGVSKIEMVNASDIWMQVSTVGNSLHSSNLPEEWADDVSQMVADWITVSWGNLGRELQLCGVSTISEVVTSLGFALASAVGVRIALGIWLEQVVVRPVEILKLHPANIRVLASHFRRKFRALILREILSVVLLSGIALTPVFLSILAERCAARAEGRFVGVRNIEDGVPGTGLLYFPKENETEQLQSWCAEPGRFLSDAKDTNLTSLACRRLESITLVHKYVVAVGTKSTRNNTVLFSWLLVVAIVFLILVFALESFSEPIKLWRWRMELLKQIKRPRTVPVALMVTKPQGNDVELPENQRNSLLGNGRLVGANVVSEAMIRVHRRLTFLLGIADATVDGRG